MQYTHKYLQAVHKAPAERASFVTLLDELWFHLYRRQTNNDSSGFEHVFLGEIRDGSVTGMHNWIQIYLEEAANRFNYMGYISHKRAVSVSGRRISAGDQHLVSIQFEWKGARKDVSSSLIGANVASKLILKDDIRLIIVFTGTSPEFEIALYTLCFLLGHEQVITSCGPYKIELTCHRLVCFILPLHMICS